MAERYDRAFFRDMADRSERSARVVVPAVVEIVRPRAVVDLGCGTGAWLKVFKECGIERVRGIDGSGVARSALRIEESEFTHADLTKALPVEGEFDLAVSLETAEHLDALHAEAFVRKLVGLAPHVLFSAAIPFQAGVHHVNEQWPSYWVRLFAANGYDLFDCIRPRIWHHEDVEIEYAQNTLLFVERGHSDAIRARLVELGSVEPIVDVVHPRLFSKSMRHPLLAWLHSRFPSMSIWVRDRLGIRRIK